MKSSVCDTGATAGQQKSICPWCGKVLKSRRKLKVHIGEKHYEEHKRANQEARTSEAQTPIHPTRATGQLQAATGQTQTAAQTQRQQSAWILQQADQSRQLPAWNNQQAGISIRQQPAWDQQQSGYQSSRQLPAWNHQQAGTSTRQQPAWEQRETGYLQRQQPAWHHQQPGYSHSFDLQEHSHSFYPTAQHIHQVEHSHSLQQSIHSLHQPSYQHYPLASNAQEDHHSSAFIPPAMSFMDVPQGQQRHLDDDTSSRGSWPQREEDNVDSLPEYCQSENGGQDSCGHDYNDGNDYGFNDYDGSSLCLDDF